MNCTQTPAETWGCRAIAAGGVLALLTGLAGMAAPGDDRWRGLWVLALAAIALALVGSILIITPPMTPTQFVAALSIPAFLISVCVVVALAWRGYLDAARVAMTVTKVLGVVAMVGVATVFVGAVWGARRRRAAAETAARPDPQVEP